MSSILSFISLSICGGFFFFLTALFLFNTGGINEKEEWLMYIASWALIPLCALVFARLVQYLEKNFVKQEKTFYPVFFVLSSAYFLAALGIIRAYNSFSYRCPSFSCVVKLLSAQTPSFETGKFLNFPVPNSILGGIIFGYIACICLALMAARGIGKYIRNEKIRASLSRAGYALSLFLFFLGLLNFSGISLQNYPIAFAAFGMGGIFILHKNFQRIMPPKRIETTLFFALPFVIYLLVFDPAFSVNHPHQNPILGPVSDLMLGKSLLVDIHCQYGVFMIYFLKFLFYFFPLSYQGLTLISIDLFVVQYLIVYVLLKFLLRSTFFSLAALILIFEVNYFATLGGEIAAFPSLGPLRFGLAYVLLLLAVFKLKSKNLKRQNILSHLEKGVVAVASIWSFETFFYTGAAFVGIQLTGVLLNRHSLSRAVINLGKELLLTFLYVLSAHVLLAVTIYLRAKTWPHWDYYLDYIFLYSKGGWGGMPIAPFSPWFFFVFVPFASLVAVIALLTSKDEKYRLPELGILNGLVFLSVAQFSYFVGRSHPNNLFHISVPVIILAAFWMVRLAPLLVAGESRGAAFFLYSCYFAFFLTAVNLGPAVKGKLLLRLPNYSQMRENFSKSPTAPETKEALYLVEKYAPEKNRVALFIEPDSATETLLLSRKMNVFPMNYPIQEEICPTAKERVLRYDFPLKAGDYIFISQKCGEFQEQIIRRIQEKFRFAVRETTPQQVYAIELRPK